MDSNPEKAAERHARVAIMAIFAVLLAVAIIAAFITTLEGVDTRRASSVTQPGTIGLAKPHVPLDKAPIRKNSRTLKPTVITAIAVLTQDSMVRS
jgi:hypothetical protein